MDGARFDELARMLAARGSRRGFIGALVGASAGLVLPATRRTAAACPPEQVHRAGRGCICRTTGRPPDASGYCPCPHGQTRCGAACVATGRDLANCGACGAACPAPASPCQAATCRNGACRLRSVADDAPCDDGNPCTQGSACQAGVCAGGSPLLCAPLDQCHEAGSCDESTGECVYAAKPDGATCVGPDRCLRTYICQQGACTGRDPVVCVASDQCHAAGTCNPANGACSSPLAPVGTSCTPEDADPCTTYSCSDGSCLPAGTLECNPSALGPCQECGGPGGCQVIDQPNSTTCDDGNPCTSEDTCQAGVCTPGTTVACPPPDQCYEGACNPATGGCEFAPKPDGTPCDDGAAATFNDTCQGGVCRGTPITICLPIEEACRTFTGGIDGQGGCAFTPKPDGTACSLGPGVCRRGGVCQGGFCAGGGPYVCPPDSGCHYVACDGNGGCVTSGSTFTTPGTPCNDDNLCTFNDVCTQVQVASVPPVCYTEGGTGRIICGSRLQCRGTFKSCGVIVDGDCRDEVCDGNGGCIKTTRPARDGAFCPSDGDDCTVRSYCTDGMCSHERQQCVNGICYQSECDVFDDSCTFVPRREGRACGSANWGSVECVTNLETGRPMCVPANACRPLGVCHDGLCDGEPAPVGTRCIFRCDDPTDESCRATGQNLGECDADGRCQPADVPDDPCGGCTSDKPHCCSGALVVDPECCDHPCFCSIGGCICL